MKRFTHEMRKLLLVLPLLLAAPLAAEAADCGAQPSYNSSDYLNWYACKHTACFHSADGIDATYMNCMGTDYYPVYTPGPLGPFPYGQLVLCDSLAFRNYFGFSLEGYDCYYCLTPAIQAEGNPNGLFPGPGRNFCAVGEAVVFPEGDSDGDGSPAGEDCNDNSYAIHPGATELCDGIDNDCDGTIDDGLPQGIWYRDRDHDGHGSVTSVTQCMAPAGYVINHDDCNDINSIVYPGAPEVCDGRDNDCDGDTDEESDADGDGFTACASSYSYQDCNDANPAVFPGMIEITCNGLDDDCNSSTPDHVNCPPETDGPGWSDSLPGDDDTATYPTSPGTPDVDGAGYPGGGGDAEDQDSDAIPPSSETTNSDNSAYAGGEGEEVGNPATPDVPAAGQETNPPSAEVPSPEGGSTVGEALPTDATPGDVPPSAEGTNEIRPDSFEMMGGGGCSLVRG